MGSELSQQARCCGACDRQQQLRIGGDDQQFYSAWGSESTPTGGEEYDYVGPCRGRDARPEDKLPKTPLAAVTEDLSPNCSIGGAPRTTSGACPVAGSEGPVRELLVEIAKRRPGDDLGLQVLNRNIGVMVVAEIYRGGAVDAANELNAKAGREQLQVNDLIVVINGVGGDDVAMAEECRRSQLLTLGVRRGAPRPDVVLP